MRTVSHRPQCRSFRDSIRRSDLSLQSWETCKISNCGSQNTPVFNGMSCDMRVCYQVGYGFAVERTFLKKAQCLSVGPMMRLHADPTFRGSASLRSFSNEMTESTEFRGTLTCEIRGDQSLLRIRIRSMNIGLRATLRLAGITCSGSTVSAGLSALVRHSFGLLSIRWSRQSNTTPDLPVRFVRKGT